MIIGSWRIWWIAFRQAIRNLMLHKLRSFLTMLGTLLGVASVIAMLAIGEGSAEKAIANIRQLGASNVIIRTIKPKREHAPQQAQNGDPRGNQQTTATIIEYGLTYKDLDRLQATLPNVTKAVPVSLTRKFTWAGTLKIQNCRILGTTPDFMAIRSLSRRRGRFLTWPDLRATQNVAVLAAGAAQRLFGYRDPLRRKVHIGEFAFTVVGVLKDQGSGNATPGAIDQDNLNNDIYIPITSLQRRIGETQQIGASEFEKVQLSEITLTVSDERHVTPTAAMARMILKQAHPKTDDFEIQVPLELLKQAEHERQIWNLVLGSIAGISLLVGGIGIMNIMLANVTERTREIGLRRALGAKRRDIVIQFLVEATTLSTIGGLFGVILGVGIPIMVTYVSDIQVVHSWWAVLLSIGIAIAVGIGFGVYPARRAASLDPIEALRHE